MFLIIFYSYFTYITCNILKMALISLLSYSLFLHLLYKKNLSSSKNNLIIELTN